MFRRTVGLVWLALLAGVFAYAEDQTIEKQRVQQAAELTSLDAAAMKPWHLKLQVDLAKENGQPGVEGSIEEWWASPTSYRVVYAMPTYTVTELHNANGTYQTGGVAQTNGTLDLLLQQAVHPLPDLAALEEGTADLRTEHFGEVPLDCIMLGRPIRGVTRPPLGLFPTYCLDPEHDFLRLTYEFGRLELIRNKLGAFQGKSVALDIEAKMGDQLLAKATVAVLKTESLADADFVAGPEMIKAGVNRARVASSVVTGNLLSAVSPVYPSEAKRNHVSGPVVLRAVIGKDGHVHSLVPVSYPDGLLAMSAIAAVQQWTYKPYLLNGVPTEVDTTITVNYNVAPSP